MEATGPARVEQSDRVLDPIARTSEVLWRTGFRVMLLGVVLVAITIALGG
jgi:hypothetical protein